MGHIGLNGLFSGVITSCSLSMAKHADKLSCFLMLALRDEFYIQYKPDEVHHMDKHSLLISKHILKKMQSLSNHRRVMDLNLTSEEQ
mmetsp:Transcript_39226/g.59842  ORF Transcript_39226/g.59842 Transcript_39226/m.59842 type:complete len:87 (+) Transcript_39226:11114-11374(+)